MDNVDEKEAVRERGKKRNEKKADGSKAQLGSRLLTAWKNPVTVCA